MSSSHTKVCSTTDEKFPQQKSKMSSYLNHRFLFKTRWWMFHIYLVILKTNEKALMLILIALNFDSRNITSKQRNWATLQPKSLPYLQLIINFSFKYMKALTMQHLRCIWLCYNISWHNLHSTKTNAEMTSIQSNSNLWEVLFIQGNLHDLSCK